MIGPMLLFPEETLLRTSSSQLNSFLEGTSCLCLRSSFVVGRLSEQGPREGARCSAVRTASTQFPKQGGGAEVFCSQNREPQQTGMAGHSCSAFKVAGEGEAERRRQRERESERERDGEGERERDRGQKN